MSRLDHKIEIYLNLQAMLNINIIKLFNITVSKSLVYYLKCYFPQYFALHYIHFSLINFVIGRFWLKLSCYIDYIRSYDDKFIFVFLLKGRDITCL